MRVQAVLLAAGASSRTGTPKSLAVGRRGTLLQEAAAPFAAIGAELVVVTGFHAERIEQLARALAAAVVRNTAPQRGMASSVRTGLRRAWDADFVFVHPGDCPGVRPQTLRMLASTLAAFPHLHAAIPLYHGRRGHPVLLDRVARMRVLRAPMELSLRDVLARMVRAVVEVETDDPAVRRDIDTLKDVEAWRTT